MALRIQLTQRGKEDAKADKGVAVAGQQDAPSQVEPPRASAQDGQEDRTSVPPQEGGADISPAQPGEPSASQEASQSDGPAPPVSEQKTADNVQSQEETAGISPAQPEAPSARQADAPPVQPAAADVQSQEVIAENPPAQPEQPKQSILGTIAKKVGDFFGFKW